MRFFLGIFFVVVGVSCSSSSKKNRVSLPVWTEHILANGLRVVFVPVNNTPLLQMKVLVKAGEDQEAEGSGEGIAPLVTELLKQGSASMPAEVLMKDLRSRGMLLETSTSSSFVDINVVGFETQKLSMLQNLVEILTKPAFGQEEVRRALLRHQSQKMIDQKNPEVVSLREVNKLSRVDDKESLVESMNAAPRAKKIARKDLIRFYLENYRPNRSVFLAVGSFNSTELLAQLEEEFRDWTPRPVEEKARRQMTQIPENQFVVIPMQGADLASVRWNFLLNRASPTDSNAVFIDGLLVESLRDYLEAELKWPAGKFIDDIFRFEGIHQERLLTLHFNGAPQKVLKAIANSRNYFDQIRSEGIPSEGFQRRKDLVVAEQIQLMQNPFLFANHLIRDISFNQSPSRRSLWPKKIESISESDAHQRFNQLLEPNNMFVVAAGAIEKIENDLRQAIFSSNVSFSSKEQ